MSSSLLEAHTSLLPRAWGQCVRSRTTVCAHTSTPSSFPYTISAGSDGDLVILDLDKESICRAENSYSQANGIMKVFEGWKFSCTVSSTIVRGRIVYENGKVDESAADWGKFIKPVKKMIT